MKTENIVLLLIFAALAAVVVFNTRPRPIMAPEPQGEPMPPNNPASGPAWLTYNLPWMFAPPVANIMPQNNASATIANGGGMNATGPSTVKQPCGC